MPLQRRREGMMAAKTGKGYEKHGNKFRVKVRKDDGSRGYATFETEAAAAAFARTGGKYERVIVPMDEKTRRRIARMQSPTVEQYIESLIADPELKPLSRLGYRNTYEQQIKGTPLGRTMVSQVTAGQAREFMNAVPKQRQRVYALLSKAFNAAIREGSVTVNPLRKAGLRRPRIRVNEHAPLTVEELRKLEAVANDRDRLMVQLGARAGLRPGEIGGLKPGDVDRTHCKRHGRKGATNGCKLVIQHNAATHTTIGSPKGNRSRTLTVPCSLVDSLMEYIAETERGPQGTVFRTTWGTGVGAHHQLVTNETVTDLLAVLCREAGMERVTAKRLRSTCASLLNQAGRSLPSIQNYLGHATFDETMRSYVRSFGGDDVATAEAMDTLFEDGDDK